jgi:O-antigen ligase
MRPNAVAMAMHALKPSTKKLLATIALLIWLMLYTFNALRVGLAVLADANLLVTLIYYAISGMAWIVPVGLMLPGCTGSLKVSTPAAARGYEARAIAWR